MVKFGMDKIIPIIQVHCIQHNISPPLSTFALSPSITFEIFQKIAEGGPTDDSQNQQILQAELTQLSSEKIKVYCSYKFVVLYFLFTKKAYLGSFAKY